MARAKKPKPPKPAQPQPKRGPPRWPDGPLVPTTQTDRVFGQIELMPEIERIPERFHIDHSDRDPWCRAVERFFRAGWAGDDFEPLPTTTPEMARTVLETFDAWMRSWAPKHERKIAACAWLLSEHFEPPEPLAVKGKTAESIAIDDPVEPT